MMPDLSPGQRSALSVAILADLRESIAASDSAAAVSQMEALALVDPALARALLVGFLRLVAESFEDDLDGDGS